MIALSVAGAAWAAYSLWGSDLFGTEQRSRGENDLRALAGKWTLIDAQITMLQEVPDSLKYTKDNCFWKDHLNPKVPLKIHKDGTVTLSRFEKQTTAQARVEDGRLIFEFRGGIAKVKGEPVDAVSYTAYDYQLSGKQLIISREDGMVTEKYIFKR
ncbi:MAG: hypothetical protein KatS3mg031_2631 [Chitinophagales bacterium]|nr:MAG: hypothetical protein KatS3mg031_2631 [Chitinophagales bacterium]